MRDQTIALLRALTQAHGVTGAEDMVRRIFREQVVGELITDRLGSIYARRTGSAARPVIMLAAHLDEVGFVVQSITTDGYLKFASLGRVVEQTVQAQRLRVLTDEGREVIGVVASKPIHFSTPNDLNAVTPISEMFIDIGAASAAEATQRYGIRVGQPITFDAAFEPLADSDICIGKAFDNRVGVALALEVAAALASSDHPNTVYCGANVQEEVQGRGARTAAALLKPDVGLVLEGVPADDFPGSNKDLRQGALGRGVQIRVMDGSAIMNRALNRFVINLAEELHIPYQVVVRSGGGTDAGLIAISDIGVPVTVLGVPVRYTHTANSLINLNDYWQCYRLVLEIIRRLDQAVYDQFIAF